MEDRVVEVPCLGQCDERSRGLRRQLGVERDRERSTGRVERQRYGLRRVERFRGSVDRLGLTRLRCLDGRALVAARRHGFGRVAAATATAGELNASNATTRRTRTACDPIHRCPNVTRCEWAVGGDELMVAYHDVEWGVPSHDDRHLFEMLTLEGAQAGLSWSTILRKREGYREAFAGFDPHVVAGYTADDVAAPPRRSRDRPQPPEGRVDDRECNPRARRASERGQLRCVPVGVCRRRADRQRAGDDVRSSCRDRAFARAVEGPETTRLRLRRPDDLLRVHAGRRHRRRPHGRLLPPQGVISVTTTPIRYARSGDVNIAYQVTGARVSDDVRPGRGLVARVRRPRVPRAERHRGSSAPLRGEILSLRARRDRYQVGEVDELNRRSHSCDALVVTLDVAALPPDLLRRDEELLDPLGLFDVAVSFT